jgi:beta-glucosidase
MTYSTGATPDNISTTMIPEAVAAAQQADVVVAVLGDSQHTCGEMVDRSDLDLPGGQLPLLQALTATGVPVVVLLIHGRQVTFGRNNVGLDGVDALMIGWRPGEEGGPAFLNVISGKTSPSGRLAQAWPRSVGGIGGPGAPYLYPFQGNHMGESYSAGDGPSSPLFGFGHGLSYTSFVLSKFSASPNRTTTDGTFNLSLVATNTGHTDGAVPIQVYFRDPVCYPVRIASIQLVRFKKVFLKAQESKTVSIELDAKDLRYWDDGRNGNPAVGPEGGWVVDKGLFNLVIGTAGFTSWNNPQGLLGDVEVV